MTSNEKQLSHLLIGEHFGQIVAKVAEVLLTNGLSPLGVIVKTSEESAENVKKSLVTLIEHNFITFETNSKGFVEYDIEVEEVLTVLRYPKYIYVSKMLFGDEAEYMTEELLRHGVMTMSQTIQQVVNRLAQALDHKNCGDLVRNVHKVFTQLVSMHFIQRAHTLSDNQNNYTIIKTISDKMDSNLYSLPKIDLKLIKVEENGKNEVKQEAEVGCSAEVPAKKRRRMSSDSDDNLNDKDIYWKINRCRFDQYLRDQTIVDTIKTHYDDPKAGEIVRIILKLSEVNTLPTESTTCPLSKPEIIREVLKDKVCSDAQEVDQYLMCFQEDINFRFVVKTEDRSDGMFSVNILRLFDKLVENSLSSIIENRFCGKSARIFRLLVDKKYLQQKQIEDLAMIPSKEAKQLTYNLYFNSMLKVLQCPKTVDYAPSRTFFLFTVDTVDLSRRTLQQCYQSVSNAINRRLFEVQQNKALLERKTFIDAIISSLEHQQSVQDVEQQIQDLKDSFTGHDIELLEKVNQNVKKLEQSELQIDETVFLLKTWIRLKTINSKASEKIDPRVMARV